MTYFALKIRFVSFLSIILLLIVALIPANCFANADKIFTANNKAVVVVMAFDDSGKELRQGSGFIIRKDGVIVTNYHVVSKARSIKIKVGNQTFNIDGIITLDGKNDIAILKANATNLTTVSLGDSAKAGIGEKVYVISSPQGLENTVSDGILSGKRQMESDRKILQITAPISAGSSGAPVFDKNGEVIGVATFLFKESQNLNFAVPIEIVNTNRTNEKLTAIKDSQIGDYENSAEYWITRGLLYGNANMHKEAMESFKKAIQLKPDLARAHGNLGVAYVMLGMHKEAVEELKVAVKLQPDYERGYFLLGITYGKSGMHKEAVEAFKYAIQLKPDYSEAHFNLGVAYIRLNDKSAALNEYSILKNLDQERAKKLFDAIYK